METNLPELYLLGSMSIYRRATHFLGQESKSVDINLCQSTSQHPGLGREEEIPNSKGTANFLIKWDGAKAGLDWWFFVVPVVDIW